MSVSLSVAKATVNLDPRTKEQALSCVHCGLCLPACPTYTQTFNEADSPRGRIQLMRGLSEGTIDPTASVRQHLELCLDCRACETACPSGVVYHELIEETRAQLPPQSSPARHSRFLQWMFLNIFTHPARLKWALLPARMLQKIGLYAWIRKSGILNRLPGPLRKMEQLLPIDGPLWSSRLKSKGQSAGDKPRVAFFGGCVGSVLFGHVNAMAVELLEAAGAAVDVPEQNCCGAIHLHNQVPEEARAFARQNIDRFLPPGKPPPDLIATCIAGCGAMLREYDHLLRDDPAYCERAKAFSDRVRDISEVLLQLGLPPMQHSVLTTATYHDACHLAHAQGITVPPRELLKRIPGLTWFALPESDICCGAAGTYNLTQPGMSGELADRKLQRIASTGAAICVTGNAGCALQIQSEARTRGMPLPVMHPVELLHRAVFGENRNREV